MRSFFSKITVFAIILCSTYLTSCKVGMTSESRGKPQEALLQFIQTQTEYRDGVEVTIDNNTPFIAKVDKQKKMGVRGNVYTIPVGRHWITVKSEGNTIIKKEIFTSSQETKQISLP